MRTWAGLRTFGLAVLGALALGVLVPVSASADGTEAAKACRPVVDETRVYFGKASTCKTPAVLDADRVFQAIPEYRSILDRRLTDKDVEYSMLMLKAGKKFRAAVEAAAADGSYDLVAHTGAVTWEGHAVPDVTDQAVRKVEEQK
jgi:hypothetical protein